MQTNTLFEDRESLDYASGRIVRRVRRADAIATRIRDIQDAGGSLNGVAIESGLKTSERVTAWLAGGRTVDDTALLSGWLDKVDADIEERTAGFIETPLARTFLQAFERARAPRDSRGRRGVALIFGAAGTGKTEAAEYAARMDPSVVYVLADGEARTWVKILSQVAMATGHHGSPNTGETLKSLISRLVPVGGLLIFDHAHLITLKVMEQLLAFPEMGIGIAFIGNLAVHKKIYDQKLVQLTSRANGAIVVVQAPSGDEIDAHLSPLGISGIRERAYCKLIGCQDGGLRFLYATVQKARELAAGLSNAPLDEMLLKRAAAKVGCDPLSS